MSYDVFAAPVPVPVKHRETLIGLRFKTEADALERAYALHRSGWSVYRITGSNGFDMQEGPIAQYCLEREHSENCRRQSQLRPAYP